MSLCFIHWSINNHPSKDVETFQPNLLGFLGSAIAEAFDCKLDFDSNTKTVSITK